METTDLAQKLDTIFKGFDYSVSHFAYLLHQSAMGPFFDGLFSFITWFGENGVLVVLLSIVLLLFKKTKRIGVTILVSVIVSTFIANILIKHAVGRQRPYINEGSPYYPWWLDIAHGAEREIFSFPSGHTTVTFSAMTSLFMTGNKKYVWYGYLFAVLMGFSRIYLMVHYASDVVGGAVIGIALGAAVSAALKELYRKKFFPWRHKKKAPSVSADKIKHT